jgi:hypothetical protein
MASHREIYAGKYLRAEDVKKPFRAVAYRTASKTRPLTRKLSRSGLTNFPTAISVFARINSPPSTSTRAMVATRLGAN